MRCIICKSKACINLPQHNSRFCQEHFLQYFFNQVKKAIKKENMLSAEDKILTVVSGGKDSLVLWDVLLKMGYKTDGLYINLGIGDYSHYSQEKCEQFASKNKANLFVVSLEDIMGKGIKEISRYLRRKPCAVCGLIKRYIFNRFSIDNSYQVVATGHNLDDEAATLLGNLLRWQTGYLSRQSPVMPSNHSKMTRKIKPLFRLTEKETAAYAIMNDIDYIFEECPLAKGARSILYKQTLNYLESNSPGTKQQLFFGFLREGREAFQQEEQITLKKCIKCGQPTVIETCAFCQLLDKLGVEQFSLKTTTEKD